MKNSLKFMIWKLKNFIVKPYFLLKNKKIFENLIKGGRVLIICSGPSVNDLDLNKIPGDVRIFSCKRAPCIFLNKEEDKIIDLYINYIDKFKVDENLEDFIKKLKINIFVIDKTSFIKNNKELRNYQQLVQDSENNDYYLKKLIKPHNINKIKGSSLDKTSNGMRLLQYALYFKAKEIYIVSIDMNKQGYF